MTASSGRFYGPCSRNGRLEVPLCFYEQPLLRAALAAHDFGTVFRHLRLEYNLTQEAFGDLVDLSQKRVSEIENGKVRLQQLRTTTRVAAALRIPARLLGFETTGGEHAHAEEVSWLDRRHFVQTVAAITLGITAFPGLDRLTWLQPEHDDPPLPKHVGANDVEAITNATAMFRTSDSRHGGGLLRAAAREHLRHVLRLNDVSCTEQVRAALRLATAEMAMTVAWMSYDVEKHHDARRLWVIALDQAEGARDPRSADLVVDVHLDMAHQALHQDQPDEALKLVKLANAAAANHDYPISDSTRSYLSTNMAWCRASRGEADACRRELDIAQQTYLDADPSAAPAWAAHVVPAEIDAQRGHALALLARTHRAHAAEAIEDLHTAITGYGPTYARSAAVNIPGLAACYFYAGDLHAGVRTGLEAVTAISGLSSKRAYTRLTKLAETTEPFARHPDVAELRARIATAVEAA